MFNSKILSDSINSAYKRRSQATFKEKVKKFIDEMKRMQRTRGEVLEMIDEVDCEPR